MGRVEGMGRMGGEKARGTKPEYFIEVFAWP